MLGFDLSPDGNKRLHSVLVGGVPHIAVMNADGTDYSVITQGTPEDDNWYAITPSFSPDGNKVIFNEIWREGNSLNCSVSTINIDGLDKTRLWNTAVSNVNHSSGEEYYFDTGWCDLVPKYSPDGSKIAFFRDVVFDTTANATYSKTSLYIADSDGSNATKLASVTPEDVMNQYYLPASHPQSGAALDWSPDGQRLIYSDDQSRISTVTLQGVVSQVQSAVDYGSFYEDEIAGTREAFFSPRFSPDGNIVTSKVIVVSDGETMTGTTSIELVSLNGSAIETLQQKEVTFGKDGPSLLLLMPAVSPIPNDNPGPADGDTSNLINLTNPVTNKPVQLTIPAGASLTCADSSEEGVMSVQDRDYLYPVGLAGFCFDTVMADNEVELVFVTDLTPDQVKLRKYNSSNGTYFDVLGASVTSISHGGQSALRVVYTITDNGDLDLDKTVGKIKDPVGLAVVDQSAGQLAKTGLDSTILIVIAAISTLATLFTMRQAKNKYRA